MPKSLRCITISLNDLPKEYRIVLGYLTYHSGKLYNKALYLLKNKLAKVNMFDLYNKLNSSIHLKTLQSRTAQIVLDELVRAYQNWFEFLKNPQKFKGQKIKPPKFRQKKKPHRTLTYDRTGFKVIGTKIRRWLREKHDIHVKYLWIETGFELHIIYEHKIENREYSGNKVMVIDLNSGNFMVVVRRDKDSLHNRRKKTEEPAQEVFKEDSKAPELEGQSEEQGTSLPQGGGEDKQALGEDKETFKALRSYGIKSDT